MLIRYTFKNWLSFREEATFSMVASKELQHNDRLARVNKFDLRLLPTAAIYGGNASGKTNFVRSLLFVKNLIVRGTQPDAPIPVSPFLLDPEAEKEPCTFQFELLIDDLVYDFSFSVMGRSVIEEKLVRVNSASETVLYHRQGQKLTALHGSLKPKDFYRFAFQGTRENQLYLTNAVSQNVVEFRPVYDWFKNSLMLVTPDFPVQNFEEKLEDEALLNEAMGLSLSQLDTGIDELATESVPLESLPAPKQVLSMAATAVQSGVPYRIQFKDPNERYVVTREGGEVVARKVISLHTRSDGAKVKFDLNQESTGTQRMIDLLPAFIDVASKDSSKVFVIDELDRSMHTLLTRQLLESYLASRDASSRSQLIFTTHDVLLMDQDLLRRDEMWVAERDAQGQSQLFSFAEYKELRNDTDIRKRYLQGRLGGTPQILLSGALTSAMDSTPANEGA
jgi:AAA15 family ATPase/GTPase